MGEKLEYFAYGANMYVSKMKQRLCREPLGARPAQVVDPNVYLAFSHRGGFASLTTQEASQERRKGSKANPMLYKPHGVLYRLSPWELKQLARHETGYILSETKVRTYDAEFVLAKIFVSKPSLSLKRGLRPPLKYLNLLRAGATEHGLEKHYRASLDELEWLPNDKLGPEYFDTPSVLYTNVGLLLVVALLTISVALH